MRIVLGIVAGVIAAMATIMLVELAGHAIYPPPPGLNMTDPAAVTAYIASVPFAAKLFVVLAWLLGALVGGWVAVRISRRRAATWAIGALIAAGGIYNATQIPAPLWMQLCTVLAPALGALAALHLPGTRART